MDLHYFSSIITLPIPNQYGFFYWKLNRINTIGILFLQHIDLENRVKFLDYAY